MGSQYLGIFFLLFLSYGLSAAAADGRSSSIIGVVIDENSRVGKEQKTAIKIAAQNFNSPNHELIFHFRNISSGNPLRAATAADELIRVQKVQVLIGSHAWKLVADVGNRGQVPVISLAASDNSPTLTHVRWPFLIKMVNNSSKEMECVAAIVHSYDWIKVIVIYEDDTFGDPGTLAVLSQALNDKGSEIEYRLVLPPHSSSSDPRGFIGDEVAKLLSRKSRVFIILKSSVSMAKHLFREAERIGLMGTDSVWIITDSITSLLDSSDPSFVMSMEGAIGTKSNYSEESSRYMDLMKAQFRNIMKTDYPEEDNSVPTRFLQITSTMEQFGNLETMTVEEAISSLKAHEERIKGKSETVRTKFTQAYAVTSSI